MIFPQKSENDILYYVLGEEWILPPIADVRNAMKCLEKDICLFFLTSITIF